MYIKNYPKIKSRKGVMVTCQSHNLKKVGSIPISGNI